MLCTLVVFNMNTREFGYQNPMPNKKLFLHKSHVGWFTVAKATMSDEKIPTGIQGTTKDRYRVTLSLKDSLPTPNFSELTIFVEKYSDGRMPATLDDSLGLQDWIPTVAGDEVIFAFDEEVATSVDQYVFMAGGKDAKQAWKDTNNYYGCLDENKTLNPVAVANTMAKADVPRLLFFRLLSEYEPSIFKNSTVVGMLGSYLSNKKIPSLERRAIVAHYARPPTTENQTALNMLAHGFMRLASDLVSDGQASSAIVVIKRFEQFFYDSSSGKIIVSPPLLQSRQIEHIKQLLLSNNITYNIDFLEHFNDWVSQRGIYSSQEKNG